MTDVFPIEAILIYLAMLFSPLDADRIVIDLPSEPVRFELVRNGETWRVDGNVVQVDGDSLVIFGAEGRETLKISDFVALPKNHDWTENPTFAIGGGHTLRKTATGFIYAGEDPGEIANIHFQQSENPGGEISVNLLGKVAQPGVYRMPADHSLRGAIAAAGGAASGADMRRVSILRGAAGSRPLVSSIDLTSEDAFNPNLRSGDTIHVAAGDAEGFLTHMALEWLAGVDAGDYEQAWKDAADFFRNSITAKDLANALTIARTPLGGVKSRALTSLAQVKSLPGVPDGEYAVMIFESSFEAKEKAVEVVTFMKQSDGAWKAAGYVIQ